MPEHSVRCKLHDKDIYSRFLGECIIGTININSWLVRNGWAVAYRKYSRRYVKEESFAKLNSAGIWEGNFIEPWKWRNGDRYDVEKETPENKCLIKGNISSDGEKIYHTPDAQHYSKTRITLGKGDRWFCTEADALQKGWRKSKR